VDPIQEEMIHQMYAVCGNKREVARRLDLCEATVSNYLKKIPPSEVREARANAQVEMADRVHSKTISIIDSIGPEDIAKASLVQKVTAGAILIDKELVVRQNEISLRASESSNDLLIPEEIGPLVDGITNRIRRIKLLDIQFERSNPDLTQEVQEKLAKAEALAAAEVVNAEVKSIDEFDPGN
jgi:hypothetical protein